jgi:hypothetical protein
MYETRPLREDERDWLSEVLLERWAESSSSVAVESGSCLSCRRSSPGTARSAWASPRTWSRMEALQVPVIW